MSSDSEADALLEALLSDAIGVIDAPLDAMARLPQHSRQVPPSPPLCLCRSASLCLCVSLSLISYLWPSIEAGAVVTARLYYRRVEDGVLGDIVPIPGNVVSVDEEGTSTETQIGGWSKDARLTLYIELQ
jgi:hypothetical protein